MNKFNKLCQVYYEGFYTYRFLLPFPFAKNLRIAMFATPFYNCPDGGIGRRARLKIWYSQGCAGSIPVPGTEMRAKESGERRAAGDLRSHFFPRSSLCFFHS
jgi:hypothetical protein